MAKKDTTDTGQSAADAPAPGTIGTAAAEAGATQLEGGALGDAGFTRMTPRSSRPSVAGEPVQYWPPGSPLWCGAIITSCDANGRASLYVLRHEFGGVEWIPEAPHGDEVGHWRSLDQAIDAWYRARDESLDAAAAEQQQAA